MNDYFFLLVLTIILVLYLFYFKEKLMKWEDRDSVQKSFSIRFTVTLIAGIIIWIYKIIKT
jgi:uncharacterized membrane protein